MELDILDSLGRITRKCGEEILHKAILPWILFGHVGTLKAPRARAFNSLFLPVAQRSGLAWPKMSAGDVLEQLEGLFLAADEDASGALEIPELIKVVGQYYRAGVLIFQTVDVHTDSGVAILHTTARCCYGYHSAVTPAYRRLLAHEPASPSRTTAMCVSHPCRAHLSLSDQDQGRGRRGDAAARHR